MTVATLEDIIRPGTTRGLDFVTLDELRKRTGINPDSILKFSLGEMLCNALDKDSTEIDIDVQVEGDFYRLEVADDGGKKLSLKEIKLILDFENKASSKRGFLRVSRGYLGNALKSIFGYSYALAESKRLTPPDITVKTGNRQYRIALKPDRIKEVIESEIATTKTEDDGFTTFILKFPQDVMTSQQSQRPNSSSPSVLDLVFATSIVNPTRKISYNLFNMKGTLGKPQKGKAIRQETSVLWYTQKQFQSLYEDFVRARPETQLKEFIPLFRGFTSKKVIGEILQEINAGNHDSGRNSTVQFFPTSTLKDLSIQTVERLFAVMKAKAKPIKKRSIPAVLGLVGQERFTKVQQENGWEKLRYTVWKGNSSECPDWLNHAYVGKECRNLDHVEYPYLIELAVFDRRKEDQNGLRVYSCVNFMASTEPIFARDFNVPYRLGRAGIRSETPVTIVVHLVCPVLKWLNYGKNALDNVDTGRLMEKAFDKILPIPKSPREYHPPPPLRPLSWVPHGKIGDPVYETRLEAFAAEIRAIDAQRTHPIKPSSRGWCYLLEQHGKIDKGEFDACQKTINDCRKIGFLPIDFVAEDQDITRHFKGIHNAADPTVPLRQIKDDVAEMLDSLPSNITDYWIGEKYYLMMCVEKGGLLGLFKPICDEYHVPIVSSKGWAPIRLRSDIANLSKKAEAYGLIPVLLPFYDYDPSGRKIQKKFRKNLNDCKRGTGWSPDKLIIERFGLNKEDIDKYNLTWIDNLKTGSGKEPRPSADLDEYIEEAGGRRKCEADALFKSDETLKAAEEICRRAIEKYYGPDAKERFERKENESKQKLSQIYNDPTWENFDVAVTNILNSYPHEQPEQIKTAIDSVSEKEVDVLIDNKFYGRCPRCRTPFNYSENDVGRLVKCRGCNLPMRLKKTEVELS